MTEKYKRYGFETNARVSNETVQKVRNLESEGYGTVTIAKMLGLHRTTVDKYRLTRGPAAIPALAEEKQQQIKDLRQQGKSTTEIVKLTGLSRKTVIKYGGNAPTINWDMMAAKIAALEKEGIFRRKAQAALLGVHYNTLLYHFGPDRWSTATTEDIRQIRQRYRDGELPREIAKDYGCSTSTIYCVLNYQGRFAHI